MSIRDECPCNGCKDRTATCHGSCKEKYEKWRAELDKEKKTIRDGHAADNAFLGYRKCKLKVLARVKNERKK